MLRLVRQKPRREHLFGILHIDGSGENNPPIESLSALYDELASADREHGDVAVIHDDTGWSMSAHRDGRLVLEHLPTPGGQRHMFPVPRDTVLRLWRQLVSGNIDGVLSEPWKPGYR